jgi:hypothetical protein
MLNPTIRRIEKLEAQIESQTAVCNCGGKGLIVLKEDQFPGGVRPDIPACALHGEPLVISLLSFASVTQGRVRYLVPAGVV